MIYKGIKKIMIARKNANLIRGNDEKVQAYDIKSMELTHIESISIEQVNTIDEETTITFKKGITCTVNPFLDGRKIKCL